MTTYDGCAALKQLKVGRDGNTVGKMSETQQKPKKQVIWLQQHYTLTTKLKKKYMWIDLIPHTLHM